MIMQIAIGIVVGVLLLVALGVIIYAISVFASKHHTLTTVDRYDFEEEEDEDVDEYIRRDKKIGR